MRRLILVACLLVAVIYAPRLDAAQFPALPPGLGNASINGVAVTPGGQSLSSSIAQARNLLTGQIGGVAKTAVDGQFAITGLLPGSYVVEIVDAAGQIVGTSSFVSAAAGSAAAVTVTVSSGALSAVSTVSGLAATLTTTAAESVKFAAAAAGVAGVVAPPELPTASPSQ